MIISSRYRGTTFTYGTEVFRVARDYALKTLRKTFDQDICDGSLALMACPLLCNVVRPQLVRSIRRHSVAEILSKMTT